MRLGKAPRDQAASAFSIRTRAQSIEMLRGSEDPGFRIMASVALGEAGGLAPLASSLPLGDAFRFPSKALLLPHLALAMAAGFGADRLRRRREIWPRVAALGGLAAGRWLALGWSGTIRIQFGVPHRRQRFPLRRGSTSSSMSFLALPCHRNE